MCKSNHPSIFLVLLALAFISPKARSEDENHSEKIEKLQKEKDAAIEESAQALSEISKAYYHDLELLRIKAQSEGQLKMIIEIDKFLARFPQNPTTNELSDYHQISEIQKRHTMIYEEKIKLVEAQERKINRNYVESLDRIIVELTKAGDLDSAKKVNQVKVDFIEYHRGLRSSQRRYVQRENEGGNFQSLAGQIRGSRAGEEKEFPLSNNTKIKMSWIPPGEFLMGNPDSKNDHDIQQRVRIREGFWIGKFEITIAQWCAVMGGAAVRNEGNLPISGVSWNDIAGSDGFLEKINNGNEDGPFLLPTEAQWEFAARAGSKTSLPDGEQLLPGETPFGEVVCPMLDRWGWYRHNSGGKLQLVGQKKANCWGLHDMHGNVREWCRDWYDVYPSKLKRLIDDPAGPKFGSKRITRGGDYYNGPQFCYNYYRDTNFPDQRSANIGFRVIRASRAAYSQGPAAENAGQTKMEEKSPTETTGGMSMVHESNDRSNVFWKRGMPLFDLLTNEEIHPITVDGRLIYRIYYASNEQPFLQYGEFDAAALEKLLYYKFRTKSSCMKFCNSRKR